MYLKSSFQGNEDEAIKSYKKANDKFPHDSTLDQLFDDRQFDAYQRLGNIMASEALDRLLGRSNKGDYSSLVESIASFVAGE